jgi:hypothetical protein
MAFANSASVNSTSSNGNGVPKTIDPSVMETLKISIPSKTGKRRSILIDAFRILGWETFRSEYKEELKGLEYGGYGVFDELWQQEEIHNLSYPEIVEYAKGLEFSEAELVNLRNNYYAKKAKANQGNGNAGNGSNGNRATGNGSNSNGNGSNSGSYEEPAYNSQEFDAEDLF